MWYLYLYIEASKIAIATSELPFQKTQKLLLHVSYNKTIMSLGNIARREFKLTISKSLTLSLRRKWWCQNQSGSKNL